MHVHLVRIYDRRTALTIGEISCDKGDLAAAHKRLAFIWRYLDTRTAEKTRVSVLYEFFTLFGFDIRSG